MNGTKLTELSINGTNESILFEPMTFEAYPSPAWAWLLVSPPFPPPWLAAAIQEMLLIKYAELQGTSSVLQGSD
jgi:hypothetical protein